MKVFATVKIAEDQEWKEKGELKLTEFGELVKGAEDRTSDEWYYAAEKLAQYYRFGAACGYRGDQDVCDKDTIQIPFNPVKAIHIYKLIANEGGDLAADVAKEGLGPCYPSVKDDAELSYCWATNSLKEWGDGLKYLQMEGQWKNLPYAVLAWHYYYGLGCEKNIDEAKKMMRWACLEDGRYYYPSYKILIKEMGLDSELKYISQEEWIKENTIDE